MEKVGLKTGLFLVVILAVGFLVQPAYAVKVKSATVSGSLKNGSTGLLSSGPSPVGGDQVIKMTDAPVTTNGSGLVLVVTDVCMSIGSGPDNTTFYAGPANTGTPLVTLTGVGASSGSQCEHFSPGLLVPEGKDLTCFASTGSNYSCSATGVVTKP